MNAIKQLSPVALAAGLIACGGGSSSGGGDDRVAAAEGCYFIPSDDRAFEWPGGAGSNLVEIFFDPGCENSIGEASIVLVAADAEAAAELCRELGEPALPESLATNPGVEDGSFFVCS